MVCGSQSEGRQENFFSALPHLFFVLGCFIHDEHRQEKGTEKEKDSGWCLFVVVRRHAGQWQAKKMEEGDGGGEAEVFVWERRHAKVMYEDKKID